MNQVKDFYKPCYIKENLKKIHQIMHLVKLNNKRKK